MSGDEGHRLNSRDSTTDASPFTEVRPKKKIPTEAWPAQHQKFDGGIKRRDARRRRKSPRSTREVKAEGDSEKADSVDSAETASISSSHRGASSTGQSRRSSRADGGPPVICESICESPRSRSPEAPQRASTLPIQSSPLRDGFTTPEQQTRSNSDMPRRKKLPDPSYTTPAQTSVTAHRTTHHTNTPRRPSVSESEHGGRPGTPGAHQRSISPVPSVRAKADSRPSTPSPLHQGSTALPVRTNPVSEQKAQQRPHQGAKQDSPPATSPKGPSPRTASRFREDLPPLGEESPGSEASDASRIREEEEAPKSVWERIGRRRSPDDSQETPTKKPQGKSQPAPSTLREYFKHRNPKNRDAILSGESDY